MDTIDEKDIFQLLQSPHTQRHAFELLVKKYSESLYWQIRRMVNSHDDANDVLQNTFIKAWSNLSGFRAEAQLSTWIYRIALNECFNFLKSRKSHTHISIDDDQASPLYALESDPYFDGDHSTLLFEKAIRTLPEKQRIVFTLKYFQEMKYEQISQITGTSIGALKASYHHAVKKIEEILTQYD